MKAIQILILLLLFITISAFAQKLQPFGLEGKNVTALAIYNGTLFAGTCGEGFFVRQLNENNWADWGLTGVNIRAIYPHDIGPIGWGITIGAEPYKLAGDSVLTYCWSIYDPHWVVSDSNLNRKTISVINSFDGFPDPRI